ncbi:MAG TPA: hypothetical protein PLU43_12695, partial [Lachnospiraceae bacterium]|nr:hypothetical protein [Lachnospiraceae bacterium]
SDADEAVTDKLGELSEDYAKTLTGDIGDYAHIGENTTYAAMESEFSVSLLQYEITTKQSNTLYCEFYVPLVANHLYYANDDYDDRGTVTEWIVLDVMGYEAGNDELYDEFKDAFTVFMENTSVNRKFYYSNAMYGEEILKAVEEGETPDKLDVQKLKEYKNSYQESADIGDLNESILEFGETMSADERIAEADSYSFCISKDILAAYYNEDTKKVFFSPDETEYPGSGYIELEMQE